MNDKVFSFPIHWDHLGSREGHGAKGFDELLFPVLLEILGSRTDSTYIGEIHWPDPGIGRLGDCTFSTGSDGKEGLLHPKTRHFYSSVVDGPDRRGYRRQTWSTDSVELRWGRGEGGELRARRVCFRWGDRRGRVGCGVRRPSYRTRANRLPL